MLVRNVVLALLGVAALVLNDAYDGPLAGAVNDWAGNAAVSFALYFAVLSGARAHARARLLSGAITFVAVAAFELTGGFGFMANVYDPVDLLADAVGVGTAVVADVASTAVMNRLARGARPVLR